MRSKRILTLSALIFVFIFSSVSHAVMSEADKKMVEKVSYSYIDGFYKGDSALLKAALSPNLQKFGYWKNKDATEFRFAGQLTFEQALSTADKAKAKKEFAKPDSPREVAVLDGTDKIAISKVTASWGVDYMLLAKNDDKWMIYQILWEGPSPESKAVAADKDGVKQAGLNYVNGFYEGDSSKLKAALDPKMYKFGYGIDRKSGKFRAGSRMTYEQALSFADRVKKNKNFPKAGTVKKVEVLGVMNKIGAVKITAWWGVDYMLVSKRENSWMIEQVIWASLPKQKS